jgi:phosphoenolpyruvate carboxylase
VSKVNSNTDGSPMRTPEKLRATVRMLGRILGDVIRAEDGDEVFAQIEEIRQASVGFHRQGTEEAAGLMADRLGRLSLPDTVRFAHSFACFLQITNIAEDHVQRDWRAP